ncbi:MAG: hypothetical protein Q9199_008031 [Rusavskia elegans]
MEAPTAQIYYNARLVNSAPPYSTFLGVPFIAINPPGYKDSTALPNALPEGRTFLQVEGTYLHNEILPAVRKAYATDYGVTSTVILAHSLSDPMTIVAAAFNATETSPSSDEQSQDRKQGDGKIQAQGPERGQDTLEEKEGKKQEESKGNRNVYEKTEELSTSASVAEFVDGIHIWPSHWREKYAKHVICPVIYALVENDCFWLSTKEVIDDFAGAFEKSVRVDKGVVLGGVHCLELCRAGRGWYARVFGWAVECGVAFGMREKYGNTAGWKS